jgi:hypothetical protein
VVRQKSVFGAVVAWIASPSTVQMGGSFLQITLDPPFGNKSRPCVSPGWRPRVLFPIEQRACNLIGSAPVASLVK